MNRAQRIAAAVAVPVTLAGIAFCSVYATGGFSRVTADFRGGTAATLTLTACGISSSPDAGNVERKTVDGTYDEYTAGLGINVLLYDQPLPNRNVEPLGPTRIEDMPR